MALSSNSSDSESGLSRRLEQEEVNWVRDLAKHPGFLLYQQACQECMVQAFSRLRRSKVHEDTLRAQGECDAWEKAIKLPSLLIQPTPERRQD